MRTQRGAWLTARGKLGKTWWRRWLWSWISKIGRSWSVKLERKERELGLGNKHRQSHGHKTEHVRKTTNSAVWWWHEGVRKSHAGWGVSAFSWSQWKGDAIIRCFKSKLEGVRSVCMCICVVFCAQWCLILYDPMGCGLPGSSVREIPQARILEWVAISSSKGSSRPRDWMCISCTAGRFFTREPPGKPFSKYS